MSGHPVAAAAGRLLPSSRYRHPGDVIRLIAGGVLLLVSLVASAAARRWLLGPAAAVAGGVGSGPDTVLTGIVQVACVAAAALVVAATLWHRRFRLLLGLAAGAVLAAGVLVLLGGRHPAALTDHLARGSWLASAAFPGPLVFAAATAVIVAASPWLSRP